jgi:hypothetical protein
MTRGTPLAGRSRVRAWAIPRALALATALVACLLGVCSAAAASESERSRPRVLLIGKGPDDPLLKALRAELSDLDVTVVQRDAAERLDAAAREEVAVAAIRMLPARNGVEVWMADANAGRSLLRQLIVDESPGGPNYNVIALQTAELLRTSLLFEHAPAPAAPRPPAPATPTERSPPARAAPESAGGEAGVQAGLGALYSPGGAGPAVELSLAVHYPLGSWLSLGVELGVPLGRGALEGPEGSALVGAQLAMVDLKVRLRPGEGPWFAAAGVAGGVLRLATEGRTAAPLTATDAAVVTGVGFVRAEGGVTVAPWLRVGARGAVGLSVPRVELSFAGNRAGTWGLPLVSALGFVEVPWG